METGRTPRTVLAPLRVAPVNRGQSVFRKGPLWLTVLIGIVVLQADVYFGHAVAGPTIERTIVGIVGGLESVAVAKVAVKDERRCTGLDLIKFIFGQRLFESDGEREFAGWKHRDEALEDWSAASFILRGDHEGPFKYSGEYGGGAKFVCGRLSVILSDHFERCFLSNREARDLGGRKHNPDVSAQLPPFLIVNNSDLISTRLELVETGNQKPSGEQGIDTNTDDGENFYSKFPVFAAGVLFIGFLILFGKGYERFVYGGQLFGAVVMGAGWLLGMAALAMFISVILAQ
jgi:hypothetical protein